ncbi:MAG: hypothetical protein Q8S84_02050 [bacterium]|nr:hypothetical protein [bacterium]
MTFSNQLTTILSKSKSPFIFSKSSSTFPLKTTHVSQSIINSPIPQTSVLNTRFQLSIFSSIIFGIQSVSQLVDTFE